LQVPLGLKQGETLVVNRTGDEKSYEDYLRAKALFKGDFRGRFQARAMPEQIVARDPTFAKAWGLLAEVYTLSSNNEYLRVPLNELPPRLQFWFETGEKAAQEALRLDPRNLEAYTALADIARYRGNWAKTEELFRKTLAIDANDPANLSRYSTWLTKIGRLKEAKDVAGRVRLLDPFVPAYTISLASKMSAAGQTDSAIRLIEPLNANGQAGRPLALAYARLGELNKAADIFAAVPIPDPASGRAQEIAVRMLRGTGENKPSSETIPDQGLLLNFVYAYTGRTDRLLDIHERLMDIPHTILDEVWNPEYAPLRKSERFKALVRKVGLVDYWKARGWPDLCHPTTGDDFECN
jgi:tetratricopeptide (TPR) repeat protein